MDAIGRAEQNDPARLLLLRRGHADFHAVRGKAIYSQCRHEILARAEASLTIAASPFVGWVRLDQAVCAYFDKDFSRAERLLDTLRQQAEKSGFLALQGRAEWMLGLIRMVQARFVEADHHYSTAISLFTHLGEEAHVIYLRSLRAKSYEYGGARQEAWSERLAALAARHAISDPERLFTIFEEAAQAMRRQGHSAAALGFLSEQMRAAEAGFRLNGGGDLLAFTLIARADLLSTLDRTGEAISDVARANEIWARLPPENESKRRLRVDLDVQLASLGGSATPDMTLAAVNRAIDFFTGPARSLGDQIEFLHLLQLRSQAYLRRGDFIDARDDLSAGVAEVERQRLEVASMEDRARFLAAARGLFLDLIRLDLDRLNDQVAALETLERSSNRILADTTRAHLGRKTALPAARWAETLRAALPPGTLVIRYGHLEDRLLLWTFLDGRMEFEQHGLPVSELRTRVERCRTLLVHGVATNEREEACNDLARAIIPGTLRALPAGRTVIIVPDEVIATLPFAALRLTPRGPYLLEMYRLAYSPSLAAWLTGSSPAIALSPPRSALFVSDPAFSTALFPRLPRLAAAHGAVTSCAAHYPKVEILTDRQATEEGVLAVLDGYEILQFDGHSITNSQFPEQGGLVLAPADTARPDPASSLLTAEDLPPRALRKLRLVILGACSTGLTTYQDTSEVTGLAAAFLSRGVPAIIAAAWDVPDGASARLLDHFHQGLAKGMPVEEALKTAQLDILHSDLPENERTRTWAAFQMFSTGGKP
ncbi:MAG: CHAT domain-containing protein [Thermoanaerobaculia bacterium]